MFHMEERQKEEKKGRNKKDKLAYEFLLFDELVVALSAAGLTQKTSSFFAHISEMFVSYVMVWPYRNCMTQSEIFVYLGAVRWVLCRTQIPTELFFSIGAMHRGMPVGPALKHMAFFGVRQAFKDITQSVNGALTWACGILYITACAFAIYLLFYFGRSVNAKRKFFHWALFFYYALFPLEIVRTQTACLVFLVHLGSRLLEAHGHVLNVSERALLKGFLSQKDKKRIISHTLLLQVFLFSVEGINRNRGRLFFVLSSVGIVDGVASFFPKSRGTHKSKAGSFFGALVASAVLRIFFRVYYPMWAYLIIGAGEYYSKMNDNILLPVLAYGISSIGAFSVPDAHIQMF